MLFIGRLQMGTRREHSKRRARFHHQADGLRELRQARPLSRPHRPIGDVRFFATHGGKADIQTRLMPRTDVVRNVPSAKLCGTQDALGSIIQ
jgi:hypothetical protein